MRRILVAIGFFLTLSLPSLAQTTKENTSITNAIESFLSNYCIEKKHSSESIHINKLQIDHSDRRTTPQVEPLLLAEDRKCSREKSV